MCHWPNAAYAAPRSLNSIGLLGCSSKTFVKSAIAFFVLMNFNVSSAPPHPGVQVIRLDSNGFAVLGDGPLKISFFPHGDRARSRPVCHC